jgi:hypothetical protein
VKAPKPPPLPNVNKFGPKKINPGTGRLVTIKGKGGGLQTLPSRHALNVLTKGNPEQRSINNYAKLTPTGSSAPGTYADIMNMGVNGANVGLPDDNEV